MQYTTYLRWGILTGLFALLFVPFLIANGTFLPNMFFPYITGKNFTFRIIVEIILLLYVILAIREPQYRPRSSAFMWAISIFVLWMGLATILSVDPVKSFWSNFERMEGYVGLLHLFALFIVASAVLSATGLWKRFFQTSVAASVIMGCHGLLQILGYAAISSQSGPRVDTTFGNAIYTGVYMLFNIFITLFLLVREGKSKTMQVVYGLALVLQFTTLIYSQSRGPVLGVIGGLIIAALYIAIFGKGEEWRFMRKVSFAGLGIIALMVVAFIAVRDTSFIKNSAAFSRLATVSLEDATVQSRLLYIWPMAVEGFQERPITGWGQENFNFIFNKYYPPEMHSQEQWFDRAHNQFLDWLVAGGIPAFLLYVSFFLLAAWAIFRSDRLLVPEQGVLLGLLAAYGFHSMFVFDNVMSAIYFYLLLAFAHGLSSRQLPGWILLSRPASDRAVAIVAPMVAVVILGGAWFLNAEGIARAGTIIDALTPADPATGKPVPPTERLDIFRLAISQGQLGKQESVEQLFQYASNLAADSSQSPEVKEDAFELARDTGNTFIEARPDDARIHSFMGVLYAQYREFDRAIEHYKKALELSPNKQSIMFQLGEVYLRQGETTEALAIFKQAFDAEPAYDQARFMYAGGLYFVGQRAAADALLVEKFGTTEVDNEQLLRIYSNVGLHERVVAIWKKRVDASPEDPNLRISLASAYFAAGNTALTIAELQKAAQLNPAAAAQIQQLIAQIQSGALKPQ